MRETEKEREREEENVKEKQMLSFFHIAYRQWYKLLFVKKIRLGPK